MSFRALIASTEDSLVQRLTAALGELGIQVESITATSDAVSVLTSKHFEALLLDCDLEGGMDLLKIVRQDTTSQAKLVIAFVSGNDESRIASRLGANFVLLKPINWDVVKRTLRAAQTLIIRERRGSIREKVRVPAKVVCHEGVVDVTIFDLSDGGLALRTPVLLTRGMAVEVHLRLPGSSSIIQCKGMVAWATDGLAGIEFSSVTTASARVIVSWLDRHSPHRRRNGKQSPANADL
jgi:DNA-binding response OmpR family regulator